jgi:hypothetical protein
MNETFEPCTITDNALDCRRELDDQQDAIVDQAAATLERQTRGTDIFGALELAAQFFAAYPDAERRTLVILSDMAQSANGLHFGGVDDWSDATIAELLAATPTAALTGVDVYVVGAGATASAKLGGDEIAGIGSFWRAWFDSKGARVVVFHGANSPATRSTDDDIVSNRRPAASVLSPPCVSFDSARIGHPSRKGSCGWTSSTRS